MSGSISARGRPRRAFVEFSWLAAALLLSAASWGGIVGCGCGAPPGTRGPVETRAGSGAASGVTAEPSVPANATVEGGARGSGSSQVVVDRVVDRREPDGRPSTELAPPPAPFAVATFAGGCFWCMEGPFDRVRGVVATISGYTGGREPSPTYEEVARGRTGHAEAVRVVFDPAQVTYEQLLEVYWRQIDPTQVDGQFADHGRQYRTVIFVHDAVQREAAERSKRAIEESGRFTRPIVVAIEDAGPFYRAEEYHQDYYRKNPANYQRYRRASGREAFLERVWGREGAH
jgi:methionine-S-sulfoxide reductase